MRKREREIGGEGKERERGGVKGERNKYQYIGRFIVLMDLSIYTRTYIYIKKGREEKHCKQFSNKTVK